MAIAGKKHLLLLLGLAHSLNHSLFFILPQVLFLVVAEFGTSNFAIGTVAMVASIIYGTGSLVGGALSDRISEAKIIFVSLALSGLSTVTFLFAKEVIVFGVGMILMGIWASLYHPTANTLISRAFQEKMGESMGIHGIGGSLGVMLTPLVAALLGANWGWRAAFLFFGVLCIVVSIALLLQTLHVWKSEPPTKVLMNTLNAGNFSLSSLRLLLLLNIVIGLYMKGIELFFQTYAISYTANGLSLESASFLAAIAASSLLAAGVVGQWLGGRGSDIFGSKCVLIASNGGVVISLLFLLLLPFPLVNIATFALIYGVSFFAHQPAFNSLIGKSTPASKRGIVYGLFFFTSFGIGSFSQSLTGYLADRNGLKFAFYTLTGFSLAAFLLSFLIREPVKTRKTSTCQT